MGRKRAAEVVVEAPPAPLKLDLGCGQSKREGFTGVDGTATEGVDVVHDLRVMPWPWDDGAVAEAFSSHTIEHLTGDERVAFFNELYRVLAPGGTATIIAPYWASMRSIQDWTHQWPPVCEAAFLYLNKGWREQNKLDHYHPATCDFDFTYGYAINDPAWVNRAEEARSYGVRHYLGVVDDLQVVLTKRGA